MNIEDQIRQTNFQDPEQVVNFYESNRLYYENYHRLDDPVKISDFIDVKLHYANSVTDKHHLDKVFTVLEGVRELLNKLPRDHWNYENLKGMLDFWRAWHWPDRRGSRNPIRFSRAL